MLTLQLTGWLHARDPLVKVNFEAYFKQKWGDEDKFQVALLDTAYAVMAADFEMTHIPGGGAYVGQRAGAYLKYLGVKAGVPDLLALWNGGVGMLECKSARGSPSPSQLECIAYLRSVGFQHAVVKTIAQGLKALILWGAPIDPRFLPLAHMDAR